MRNRVQGLILIVLFAELVSCGRHKKMNVGELNAYILDEVNGLHKQINKNSTEIEVFYKPSQIVWLNEIRNAASDGEKQQYLKACDSLNYFVLQFSRQGKEIESAYSSQPDKLSQLISYLSYDIKNDLHLSIDGDTIPALDVVYARTFGSSSATNVLAVFNASKKIKDSDNAVLYFDDSMLETGFSGFAFKCKDIANAPTLNFD